MSILFPRILAVNQTAFELIPFSPSRFLMQSLQFLQLAVNSPECLFDLRRENVVRPKTIVPKPPESCFLSGGNHVASVKQGLYVTIFLYLQTLHKLYESRKMTFLTSYFKVQYSIYLTKK